MSARSAHPQSSFLLRQKREQRPHLARREEYPVHRRMQVGLATRDAEIAPGQVEAGLALPVVAIALYRLTVACYRHSLTLAGAPPAPCFERPDATVASRSLTRLARLADGTQGGAIGT